MKKSTSSASTESPAPLVVFNNVTYIWPDPETGEIDTATMPVFDAFSAEIPGGFVSLTGPNGSGKSTFMLLAGGRIMPTKGIVSLGGINTRILAGLQHSDGISDAPGLTQEIEHRRNLLCSYIYQNMEFDKESVTDAPVGTLLEYVYANGGYASKAELFLKETYTALGLNDLLLRKLDALSKGELQRVLLAFAALYGSQVIMMDEPVFAMEQFQKESALDFFRSLCKEKAVSVFVSLHELTLTRKYADTVMLFYPDRNIDLGTPEEVLVRESLEKSYGVPESMLYDAERLNRSVFIEENAVISNNSKVKGQI